MTPSLSRPLAIVAVFVLAGPFVGALVFGVLVILFTFSSEPGLGLALIYAAITFFPLAYLVGGMQALFTGIVTAATAWWRGSTPLWVPLAAALTAGALVASRSYENWDTAFIVLAVHAASAWACWALVCRWPGWNDDASLSGS